MTDSSDRGAGADQPRPGRGRAAGRRSRRGCPWPARSRRRGRRRSAGTTSASSALRAGTRSPRAAQAPARSSADLPDRGGGADRGGEDGGGGVAADGDALRRRSGSSARAPPAQPRGAGQPVGDAFDQARARRPARRGSTVRKRGSSAVGISWPTSARRLAAPIPRTPGVSQASVDSSGCASSVTPSRMTRQRQGLARRRDSGARRVPPKCRACRSRPRGPSPSDSRVLQAWRRRLAARPRPRGDLGDRPARLALDVAAAAQLGLE